MQSYQYGQVFRDYTNPGQWGRDAVETNYFLNHRFQVGALVNALLPFLKRVSTALYSFL